MIAVYILGYKYSLTYKPLSEMNGNIGLIDLDNLKIDIASDVPLEIQRSTLVHEMIEAINYHLEIGLSEAQIKQLEVGLSKIETKKE